LRKVQCCSTVATAVVVVIRRNAVSPSVVYLWWQLGFLLINNTPELIKVLNNVSFTLAALLFHQHKSSSSFL